MAENVPFDPFAFQPFEGGGGVRLTCTTNTSSAAVPGTQASDNTRVLVTNGGSISAFVRFGQSGVTASLNSMEVLPGTTQVFSVPYVAPSGLYVAGITESGSTKISVTAGRGV
jgi:hypothetical protein